MRVLGAHRVDPECDCLFGLMVPGRDESGNTFGLLGRCYSIALHRGVDRELIKRFLEEVDRAQGWLSTRSVIDKYFVVVDVKPSELARATEVRDEQTSDDEDSAGSGAKSQTAPDPG